MTDSTRWRYRLPSVGAYAGEENEVCAALLKEHDVICCTVFALSGRATTRKLFIDGCTLDSLALCYAHRENGQMLQ